MSGDITRAYGILLCRILGNIGINNTNNIMKNIEFLFLRASYGTNHWTPPKGLVEENEEGLTTAIRETAEETGLNKDRYKLLNFEQTLKYLVNGKPKETTYYLAILLNKDENIILSDEHTDYRWIKSEQSNEYSLSPSLQDLMINAEKYLENNSNLIQ
ncbi:bis(5'-nucleosyl)-tetraphosphatase [asymmetrical], putative [Plasmodium chabaudi chabaudi]|uniref:Bis(5'-nucleosyl)-tetraphosphatase [asymmetrical] n=1 Tax=Plasmodium chabaudi chabaudi TaxID=31271 RepID=A0A1C6YPE8_PLACU|nr:bis(5'-nucleosyl)-tetraphosphatase [asymmetrical], putative [Plasmodium chabaudi chabaudi]